MCVGGRVRGGYGGVRGEGTGGVRGVRWGGTGGRVRGGTGEGLQGGGYGGVQGGGVGLNFRGSPPSAASNSEALPPSTSLRVVEGWDPVSGE